MPLPAGTAPLEPILYILVLYSYAVRVRRILYVGLQYAVLSTIVLYVPMFTLSLSLAHTHTQRERERERERETERESYSSDERQTVQ